MAKLNALAGGVLQLLMPHGALTENCKLDAQYTQQSHKGIHKNKCE